MTVNRITVDRWEQAQGLFHEALALPVSEREAFLHRACGDDTALRSEVAALLRFDEAPPSILDASLGSVAASLAAPAEPRVEGREVGPYVLLRQIGQGGMGTVYLAERADVGMRVAVKVVRGGLAAPDAVRRFLMERRVLARLEHPNIARLLDAGVTPNGEPYFAMEYVDGARIDRYCDAHRLDVRERLTLFTTVCAAVAYAHRNLVVHRDIKPSNILVTPAGEVKLLDFGIAKLLEGPDADVTLTVPSLRLMTPEYASPEQVLGRPVTTATDVYALGLLLYELISGHRAYRLRGRTPAEIDHAVVYVDPLPPSVIVARTEPVTGPDGAEVTVTPSLVGAARSTRPDRLRRQLRGDLDNIVLKALAKEPERRYPSAEQLDQDIGRHRRGEPVMARAGTLGYRLGKFVRRHRAGVAATAALGVLVAGFVVSILAEQRQTARERDRARLEAAKAEQVTAFLTGLFKANEPFAAQGRTITATELLERGVARADSLARQPALQAQLLGVIGDVFYSMGAIERARSTLERALARQRTLYPGASAEVAHTLVSLSNTLTHTSDLERADTVARETVAMNRTLHGDGSPEVGESLVTFSVVLLSRRKLAEAERAARDAVPMTRRRGEQSQEYCDALHQLGTVLWQAGRDREAEPLLRHALAIEEARMGADSPMLVDRLNNLGVLLGRRGDYAAAEPLLRRVLAVRRKFQGDDNPWTLQAMNNFGMLLLNRGRYDEAEPLLRQALAGRLRLLGEHTAQVATSRANLGVLLRERGAYVEAEGLLRSALATDLGTDGGAVEAARDRVGLADVLVNRRRYGEAEALYRTALDTLRGRLAPTDQRIADALVGLGTLGVRRGASAEAERFLREGVRIRESGLAPSHWKLAQARSELGACLLALGRESEAAGLLRSAYDSLRATRGEQDPMTRAAYAQLAALGTKHVAPAGTAPR